MQLKESLHPRFKAAIESFLGNLSQNLEGSFEVYFFGSLARGDYLLDSDIDLIVVTDALREMRPWERTAYLRKLAPPEVGFDIFCYTHEEFKRVRPRRDDLVSLDSQGSSDKNPEKRRKTM